MSPPLLKPRRKPGAARQVVSQRLVILPCGPIRGGNLSFSCHPATGELYYVGEVFVRLFLFTRRHRFHGAVQVSPLVLRSANVKKGMTINCRNVRATVEVRYEAGCELMLDVIGICPGTGAAQFDLSKECVRLKSAMVSGVVRGSRIFGHNYITLSVEDGD